jgi:hypothetical protein
MALSPALLDNLFAKLGVRYGAAFLRQWPDVDIAHIKADWAEVLDGFHRADVLYALQYLAVLPPNALQFRDICRRAPRADVLALEDNATPADPARVAAVVAELRKPDARVESPNQVMLKRLLWLQANGSHRLTPYQREAIALCQAKEAARSGLEA